MASERQFPPSSPDRRRPLPQWHRRWLFLAVLLIFLGEALADQSPFPIPDASKRPVRTPSESAKTVVDLQPFRRSHTIAIKGRGGQSGTATLIELNPVINTWFVLTLDWGGAGPQSRYHLENPDPHNQYLQLTDTAPGGLIISDGGRRTCDLWADDVTALQRAASSPLPYAPLCEGRLLLRNRVSGHHTGLERTAEIFRDYLWHGEAIVGFVRRKFFADAYIEKPGSQVPDGSTETGPELPIAPRPAQVKPAATGLEVAPGTMGIATEGAKEGRFIPGRWYPAKGLPSIYVSVIQPMILAEPILNSYRDRVNPLDPTEASALDYLVAFDLTKFDLGFSVGTEHPGVDWSPRVPDAVRNNALPGPDGIGTIAPLVGTGMVAPSLAGRTVATFTGGFKRTHGAFRYGELSLRNSGSHYGFIEAGVVLSKLQPDLATLYGVDDGSIHMETWSEDKTALLPHIRFARQNGVPLIERNPVSAEPTQALWWPNGGLETGQGPPTRACARCARAGAFWKRISAVSWSTGTFPPRHLPRWRASSRHMAAGMRCSWT